MAARSRRGLLYLAFTVLLLPMVQQGLRFVDSGELHGGHKLATDTTLSVATWWSGTYQQRKEEYLNDAVGFRIDLVRLNNQVDYSLFDKCHAWWTLKGKDNYLFQRPYIDAYYGSNFVGFDHIHDKGRKLRAVKDTLARMGKSLIVVYAASKVSSYPEYLPDRLMRPKTLTNHDAYLRYLDTLGIDQVDMDSWFVAMKGKSKEPLFNKQGIHWTRYGAVLACDSLMRYIEKLRGISLPMPDWSHMEYAPAHDGDDDVALELNLIFPIVEGKLAYPQVRAKPDSTRKKLKAVYIGDSFGFKLITSWIPAEVHEQFEFWGYFDDVHDFINWKGGYIKEYDWMGSLLRTDVVVLIYTTFNLDNLGSSFIEQAYDRFYPHK